MHIGSYLFIAVAEAQSKGTFSKLGGGSVTQDNNTALGLIAIAGIILAIVCIVVLILKWLWNSTFPQLFGVKSIGFWQMLRLWLFVLILLGGLPNFITTSDSGITLPLRSSER